MPAKSSAWILYPWNTNRIPRNNFIIDNYSRGTGVKFTGSACVHAVFLQFYYLVLLIEYPLFEQCDQLGAENYPMECERLCLLRFCQAAGSAPQICGEGLWWLTETLTCCGATKKIQIKYDLKHELAQDCQSAVCTCTIPKTKSVLQTTSGRYIQFCCTPAQQRGGMEITTVRNELLWLTIAVGAFSWFHVGDRCLKWWSWWGQQRVIRRIQLSVQQFMTAQN